jgi:hypothetical protein
MKQITNKTILKQGDKTYQPIEHDGNIHWVDSSILVGMEGDWVVETHNPVVISVCQITKDYADLRVAGYKDMKVIAQSQPKLPDIPIVSLNSYVDRIAKEILPDDSNWQRRFDIVKGFKSNPNQYTQADIEKIYSLVERLGDDFSENYTIEELLKEINSISVIEVDEKYNIISYE